MQYRATYAYDPLNRRTEVVEADGTPRQRTTVTAYDPVGNVLSVTQPRNYDHPGPGAPVNDVATLVTSYAYDPVDERVLVRLGYNTELEQDTTIEYDAV